MSVSRRNFLSSLWPAAVLAPSALHRFSAATLPSGGGSGFAVKFVDVSTEAGLRQHRKLVAEIGSRERPHLDMKIEKPY